MVISIIVYFIMTAVIRRSPGIIATNFSTDTMVRFNLLFNYANLALAGRHNSPIFYNITFTFQNRKANIFIATSIVLKTCVAVIKMIKVCSCLVIGMAHLYLTTYGKVWLLHHIVHNYYIGTVGSFGSVLSWSY